MPETTKDMQKIQAAKKGAKIYWSKAEKHQIGNWQKEVKEAGYIIQPEKPLRFSGHMVVAEDTKTQKFIENSGGFKAGDIRLVESVEEANKLTAQQGQMKQVTSIMSSDITRDGEPVTA